MVMRCIALAYQVWLAGRIGSAGIGLFQLVMSVSLLCTTFAISGIRFASTRLVSEEMGYKRPGGVRRAVHLCLGYGLFFGLAAMAVLWLGAEPIGFLWVGDARTVLSLQLLSVSLPFVALSSVFSGYFSASGRVWKSAFAQVAEQILRIALVALFLTRAPEGDIEKSCAAVVLGGTTAEVFSFFLHLVLYLTDTHRHIAKGLHGPRLPVRMLGVAVPLALSAYARTALSTLQHLLVPRGLKGSGLTADAALAGYGIIHGMVFPIVMFPSCILLALSELLVPELTEAQVSGRSGQIQRMVSRLFEKCLLFSVGAAAILYANAENLGLAVYGSVQAGTYIKIFAFLVPVMYLDMVTDGCLKGLGQQLWSMGINIADSAVSVLLVVLLLPRYALWGYIAIICFTELFNFLLSIWRLHKVSPIRFPFAALLLSIVCALGAVNVTPLLLRLLSFSGSHGLYCLCAILLGTALYVLLLRLCGLLPRFWKKSRLPAGM